jgi:hypothetical protein
MHLFFTMKIKTVSANLLHVSVTFCGHLQGGVFRSIYYKDRGPLMVAQWLRYCATNRKVAGSIPDGVIGLFH